MQLYVLSYDFGYGEEMVEGVFSSLQRLMKSLRLEDIGEEFKIYRVELDKREGEVVENFMWLG